MTRETPLGLSPERYEALKNLVVAVILMIFLADEVFGISPLGGDNSAVVVLGILIFAFYVYALLLWFYLAPTAERRRELEREGGEDR